MTDMSRPEGAERRKAVYSTADREFIEQTVVAAVRALALKVLGTFAVVLLVQGATFVWWASGIDQQVSQNTMDLVEIVGNRYTDKDSQRDWQLRDERIAHLAQALARIEGTINATQAAVAQMTATLAVVVSRQTQEGGNLDGP